MLRGYPECFAATPLNSQDQDAYHLRNPKIGFDMSAIEILSADAPEKAARGPLKRFLFRAEWRLVALVALLCIGCVVSAALRDQTVAWGEFFAPFGASVLLILIGMYVRATRPMPRIALGAIGFGIFMSFTGSVAIFIYTLFPVAFPLIDPSLMAIDASLGYVWTDFVQSVAAYPMVGLGLRYVYLSILPQMVAVIVLLAFLNRPVTLHRFLSVGIFCMIVTVTIWSVFPSVGPGANSSVPVDVASSIDLVLDMAYAAELQRLAAEGIPVIAPNTITGVIAFPSFHMIMACMVVWFTRDTVAFIPALVVNIAMVPATLSHGGHHLVDLVAGVVAFFLCVWAVNRLIPVQSTT